MPIPVRVEQEWARKYPVPYASEADSRLLLWNYPIAKSDLPHEHQEELLRFLAGEFMHLTLSGTTETRLFVRGHASDSGEAPANEELSRDRARKVARFLVSKGFPASQVSVEWAGSREPLEPGSSGYAGSRNRRVDVVRFAPPVREELPPIGDPPPDDPKPKPGFRIPRGVLPSSLTVDIPLDIPLPPIKTAELLLDGKIGGVLKVKVTDNGGGWGGGVAIKDGKLTAKFEAKLLDDVKGKVSFEPKSGQKAAVLKVGGEFKVGKMDWNVGLQTKLPNLVYAEFSFEAFRLPDIVLGDVHVSMTMKPTLKIEAGPGPAMAARLAAASTPAAVVVGTVVGSALIIVGTAKVVEYAKEESLRYTRLLALRSGVAARVAYEIVGTAAEVDFRQDRVEWTRTLDEMAPSYDAGVKSVNALLHKGDREKLRAEWTKKYAEGTQVFTDIQPRVFNAVGGYDKGEETEDPAARL